MAGARAFGRGPIFSRRWMRFCVTRRGARAWNRSAFSGIECVVGLIHWRDVDL